MSDKDRRAHYFAVCGAERDWRFLSVSSVPLILNFSLVGYLVPFSPSSSESSSSIFFLGFGFVVSPFGRKIQIGVWTSRLVD